MSVCMQFLAKAIHLGSIAQSFVSFAIAMCIGKENCPLENLFQWPHLISHFCFPWFAHSSPMYLCNFLGQFQLFC